MFDLGLKTSFRDITDGTSNTLCLGEGASGGLWRACIGQGCTTGGVAFVGQAWMVPQPVSSTYKGAGLTEHTSIFGSTFDQINKNPITETLVDDSGFNGAAGCTSADSDSTSNFSSYHPGGGNFAFADGSVDFLSETIDMTIYRGLSTTQGGEAVSKP